MRVVSLLPAATEIVAALGGEALLVGISHECDFPPSVRTLPRVTRALVDSTRPSAAIARQVAARARAGGSTVAIDGDAIRRLRPDVVISQAVCPVCAASDAQLAPLLPSLHPTPRVILLHPHTVGDVLGDIGQVGAVLARQDEAGALVAGLRQRLARLSAAPESPGLRVLVLEWLDPPYVAGHWVPELTRLAGAHPVGMAAGGRSVARPWRDLAALAPDVVVIALCGFDIPRARAELALLDDPDARVLLGGRVEFLDGNAYTSRPGPRLVDAAEILARRLHG